MIVTIMLNYIANFLLLFLLTTPAFQRKGSTNPISPFLDPAACSRHCWAPVPAARRIPRWPSWQRPSSGGC